MNSTNSELHPFRCALILQNRLLAETLKVGGQPPILNTENLSFLMDLYSDSDHYLKFRETYPADLVCIEITESTTEWVSWFTTIQNLAQERLLLVAPNRESLDVLGSAVAELGAQSIYCMDSGLRVFWECLRTISKGRHFLDESFDHQRTAFNQSFPPRMLEVVSQLSEGMKPLEVAEKFGMSKKTVSTYIQRLREAFGVNTLEDALREFKLFSEQAKKKRD